MALGQTVEWFRQHRWWVALIIVIIAGYSVGKDRALRDNRDAATPTAGAKV